MARMELALEDAYASVTQPCTVFEKAWAGALATAVTRFVDAGKIKCMARLLLQSLQKISCILTLLSRLYDILSRETPRPGLFTA